MAVTTSRTSQFAAFILITVNLCATAAWGALLAVGVWLVAAPGSLNAAVQATGSTTLKALLPREVMSAQQGVALALAAALLLLVCLLGLYAAVARTPFLLVMYSALVLLLLLLECALLYYFSSYFIEKGLQMQDGQWTHALRLAFSCCEFNASASAPAPLPWSCCGAATFPDNCTAALLHAANCQASITQWIARYQTAVYGSLAVLHVVLSSCSLARRRRVATSLSYT